MEIAEQINEILYRRKGLKQYEGNGHLQVVLERKNFFLTIKQKVIEYQTFRESVLQQIHNQRGEYYNMSLLDLSFEEKINNASPEAVIRCLDANIKECERLERRFSRDAINISVVGRARQGKSCLLRSISGLNNEIIPTANGGDCTGAKSVLCNQNGTIHAEIISYSEMELIEHVRKYLEVLHINKFIGSVSNIKDLQSEVNSYMATLNSKSSKEQSWFLHFRKYVDHFDEYINLIGKTINLQNEAEIRSYVAQYESDGTKTYKYLAVKEARIYSEFPCENVGKIVLVDTIGLGDTSLGIQDKMIDTLKNDSDAAILVRLPAPNGDGIRIEDDELYDLIRNAMGDSALEKWLFFALNVCDELNNINSGIAFEQALKDRKWHLAFSKEVNCANQEDVERNLLIPILEYLTANLKDVDNNLLQNANKLFDDTYLLYFSLCGKIQQVITDSFKQNVNLNVIFEDEYENLSLFEELQKLNSQYKSSLNTECDLIDSEIGAIIKTMVNYCPEKEDIIKRLRFGTEHRSDIFNHFADSVRTKIADSFEIISNSTITKLQEDIKHEIINLLYEPSNHSVNAVFSNKSI